MPVLASSAWGNDRKSKADQSPFRGFFDKVEDLPVGKKGDLAFVNRLLFVHDGTTWKPVITDAIPSRTIWIWSGSLADIPPGFVVCDGTNGTPDLRNRFVIGAGNNYSLHSTGGASSVSHSHGYSDPYSMGTIVNLTQGTEGRWFLKHHHKLRGSFSNLPPYINLAFIMKL